MGTTDPNDTMTLTGIIKTINEIDNDRLIVSRDTNNEAQADSEVINAIYLTTHAHQVILALEVDLHIGIMNMPALYLLFATCDVSNMEAHKHTLADRKCIPSLEQIKANLMRRNFPAHQVEALIQLHSNKIASNVRNSKESSSSSKIPRKAPKTKKLVS